jgi:hypothetical protein
MGMWEIIGLFGNEYALDNTIEDLKENGIDNVVKLDRRYISVRFEKRNKEMEEKAKRIIEFNHGFIEAEAHLGEYDKQLRKAKIEKVKKEEKKRKISH